MFGFHCVVLGPFCILLFFQFHGSNTQPKLTRTRRPHDCQHVSRFNCTSYFVYILEFKHWRVHWRAVMRVARKVAFLSLIIVAVLLVVTNIAHFVSYLSRFLQQKKLVLFYFVRGLSAILLCLLWWIKASLMFSRGFFNFLDVPKAVLKKDFCWGAHMLGKA